MSVDHKKLADVCSLVNRGITPSYINEGGVLVYNQKCVRDGTVINTEARRTDPSKKQIPEDRYLTQLDILVNSTGVGTLGRVGQIKDVGEKSTIDSHITLVRAKSQCVDPLFLGYVLKYCQPEIERLAEGSTGQTELSRDQLKNLYVPVPLFPEQRAIAGILGALDDKIEHNRRMNRTLESMARAVFRKWFVENQEKNEWEKRTLGDVFTVLETGSRPKGGVSQESVGIPSIGAESIVKLGYFDFSKTKFVPFEFYESMRRGHIEDRDVLLYKDGGRPGEFEPHVSMFGDGFPFEKYSINEHVYRMRISQPLTQAYLYFWLESDEIMEELRNRGTGVAVPGLNTTALSGINIVIPPHEPLDEFSKYVEPLVGKIFSNAKESRTLASLRDTLLPRLMRGEVRVGEL